MLRAILFDLDGTLADTAVDLGGALNAVLCRHGLPVQDLANIRPIAGHGSEALLKLGTGITSEHPEFKQWQQEYLDEYGRCFDHKTALFHGINDMLLRLFQHDLVWGIVTNKPETFTNRLLPKLNFSVAPSVVVCGDTCAEPKPSILPMRYACEHIDVLPKHCLYVGDAQRDIEAGRNAGMQTVLASWGYIPNWEKPQTWGADYWANSPEDVLHVVESLL